MSRSETLADRVATIEARIAAWKIDARGLAVQASDAMAARNVDPKLLVFVEELAGAIYEEIEDLEHFAAGANLDPGQRTKLSTLGDALRLVLLEVTEHGTRMYSARSAGEPLPLIGVSLQKAHEILKRSGLVVPPP